MTMMCIVHVQKKNIFLYDIMYVSMFSVCPNLNEGLFNSTFYTSLKRLPFHQNFFDAANTFFQ